MNVKQIFEAWDDPDNDCLTFATVASLNDEKKKGLISSSAYLLHRLEASTFEEAMTKHHELMGWEPYRPMGTREKCPNDCGGEYYPEGSGQCPNCGKIC